MNLNGIWKCVWAIIEIPVQKRAWHGGYEKEILKCVGKQEVEKWKDFFYADKMKPVEAIVVKFGVEFNWGHTRRHLHKHTEQTYPASSQHKV